MIVGADVTGDGVLIAPTRDRNAGSRAMSRATVWVVLIAPTRDRNPPRTPVTPVPGSPVLIAPGVLVRTTTPGAKWLIFTGHPGRSTVVELVSR